MTIRQVPQRAFPSGDGRWIALLAVEPGALTERYGLVFEEDDDELGHGYFAFAELPGGHLVFLEHRPDAPIPGMKVMVDIDADDVACRQALLPELGLSDADVLWKPNVARRGRWHLMRHDLALGTLILRDIDQPVFYCVFQPTAAFEDVRPVFDELRSRLGEMHRAKHLDPDEERAAAERMERLSLRLEEVPDRRDIGKFVLNIYRHRSGYHTAWFRSVD